VLRLDVVGRGKGGFGDDAVKPENEKWKQSFKFQIVRKIK
jgi:hypothetical protein